MTKGQTGSDNFTLATDFKVLSNHGSVDSTGQAESFNTKHFGIRWNGLKMATKISFLSNQLKSPWQPTEKYLAARYFLILRDISSLATVLLNN